MKQVNNNGNSLATDITSNSLIERVRAQDEDAWRCLTELYGPLVYQWCRKGRLREEDAADVLQEVFRSLVINISAFKKSKTSGSFRAWLWAITQNKVRDFFKVQRGKAEAIGGSDAQLRLLSIPVLEPEDEADSAVTATGTLTNQALNIVRGEVKESTWQAFWRSTIDDISPIAVADELGISVESVWQAKSRVLRRVRQLLE